jgi:hypothetical protein
MQVQLAASPVTVQVEVEGVVVHPKEAVSAEDTVFCVAKVAVLWDEATIHQLKLSTCSNPLGNFSQYQDSNGI